MVRLKAFSHFAYPNFPARCFGHTTRAQENYPTFLYWKALTDRLTNALPQDCLVSPRPGREFSRNHQRCPLIDLLAESGPVGQKISVFQRAFSEAGVEMQTLAELAGSDVLAIEPDGADWLRRLGQRLEGWIEQGRSLRDWCAWRKACHEAEHLGLAPLVDALLAERVAAESLQTVLEAAYARWWLAAAVDEQPRLRGFVAAAHEEQIDPCGAEPKNGTAHGPCFGSGQWRPC